MKIMRHLVLGLGFLLIGAASASAQQPSATAGASSDRWAPWLGCWRVSEESVQDAATVIADMNGRLGDEPMRGAVVCVTPADGGGATMTTRVDDRAVLVETIVADATERPLTDQGCRGWQKAEWSALGPRVYATAEITCDGQAPRTVSGMAAVVSGPTWIDIQAIESEGRKSVRVRRYHRVADRPGVRSLPRPATMPLGGKLSLAEIKEAAAKVAPEALQAAVIELGAGGYELNSRRLLDLDAAGVPDSVTDLMVAMSFPKRFVVERASSGGGGGGFGPMFDPSMYYSAMLPFYGMWPYYYDDIRFMGAFSYHPSYYSTYYSPFGYGNWGYYNPSYGYPGVIIVDPGNGGAGTIEPSGDGRVVNGQGYTRIRRVQPEPSHITRGGNGGSSTGSTGSNSGSSAGGSGVSTGGYSGGGSGGGGGRTAVPRPPGGK